MGSDIGKPLSRRQMIGGLGSGIAAAAVAPAFGQQTSGQGQEGNCQSTAQPVEDPITKYPKPPYNFVQPWPDWPRVLGRWAFA